MRKRNNSGGWLSSHIQRALASAREQKAQRDAAAGIPSGAEAANVDEQEALGRKSSLGEFKRRRDAMGNEVRKPVFKSFRNG